MRPTGAVNIVYLDDAEEGLAQEIKHIQDVFMRVGLESCVLHVSDYDREVKSQKHGVFGKEVVDVFITDIYLGGKSPEGLTAAQEVKRRYPNVFVIAISGKVLDYSETARKTPSFDLFIHRTYWRHEKYKAYIAQRIGDTFKRNVHARVDDDRSELPRHYKSKGDRNELNSLVRTITFTSHVVDPKVAVSNVVLTPLDGGRSSSDVFEMNAETSQSLRCVGAVLKIDSREKSLQELENYEKYVKWYLPYQWRTEMLGAAQTQRRGAICYAFAHGPETSFFPVSVAIESGDHDKVLSVINRIFDPGNQRWYAKENQVNQKGLTPLLDNKWFTDRVDPTTKFRQLLTGHDLSDPNCVTVYGRTYPMPRAALLGFERDEYVECICHGDLHSGNILVTNSEDIVFIDFQMTGPGHVFEDFVAFEASLRGLWPLDISFEEAIAREWHMLHEPANIDGDFEALVNRVRQFAWETFDETKTNYVYALALQSFRAIRADWLEPEQARRHVACLLSCIRYLKDVS